MRGPAVVLRASVWPAAVAVGLAMACERPPSLVVDDAAASASASASLVGARAKPSESPSVPKRDPDLFPLDDDDLARIMNPKGLTEYTGPTGAVEGVVHVTGDPPEMRSFMRLPPNCAKAAEIHGPSYRKGPKDTLIDALVGVIGYSGYVRASRQDRVVTIKDCSLLPTVIDLSLGQRLMIGNEDSTPYTPQTPLPTSIRRLAIKGQSPVPVLLTRPGAYGLTWLTGALPGAAVPDVTVFVIPNALHVTSGPEGRYRITGIPVGSAWVTGSHVGMEEARQQIQVEAGKTVHVDLTLKYKRKPQPSTSTSTSSSVPPLQLQ